MSAAMSARSFLLRPIFPAALIVLSASAVGYSKDFGVFLLAPVLAVTLLPFFVISVGVAASTNYRGRMREIGIGFALVALAPFLAYGGFHIHNRLAFAMWAPWHKHMLNEAVKTDGIVLAWESRGFAGSDNDSYLVVDTHDEISSIKNAENWRLRLNLNCEIVDTERVWSKLYIVTTYNCPLEGSEK